jgi:hypothetical protein
MKVVLIETLDLKVVELPFPVSFAATPKRGISEKHWFTPTGNCKLYFGSCHTMQLGSLADNGYQMLMDAMKKAKCDLLTDGYDYYTTGDKNIIKLNNMSSILYKVILEWNGRKDGEYWDELNRGEEFIFTI